MLESLNLNVPLTNHHRHSSSKSTTFKYIMIHQTLENNFNLEQWNQISELSSATFMEIQNKIYEDLIGCQELFQRYFSIFYGNHVKLYHWYLLAREKHHVIKPYIYQFLLRKKLDNHQDDMKFLQLKLAKEREREKQKQQKNKIQPPVSQTKTRLYKIDDLTHQIFNFMASKSKTASLLVWEKPWSFKKQNKDNTSNNGSSNQLETIASMTARKNKRKKLQVNQELLKKVNENFHNHDFHELYIQTFNACDGPRYIFYDYEKHMKGINERDKYNTFIRASSKGKAIDLRLTENSEQEPIFKELKSCTADRMRTSYEYSPVGNALQDNLKKRSKVIFRRTKRRNVGKFIRK